MTSNLKALEKKLDRDYFQYFSLAKKLYENVKSEEDKTFCEAWLNHLCGKCFSTVGEKRERNIYLSRLLLQMQEGKLKEVFLCRPPHGNLQSPFAMFGMPLEVEDVKGFQEMGFQLDADAAGGSGDFTEVSRDGRTYLATRRVTNGMMAFIAVTVTEDEPVWLPQQARLQSSEQQEEDLESAPVGAGRFIKKLTQLECIPLTQLRKSPEERQRVLEWMDKIIEDCNRWLRGEDPQNSDLKTLFELLYKDYEEDPEKCELLQYPRDVRDVLMREIRDKITERREEVSRRELILDLYEADEYEEEKFPAVELDSVWVQSARRPMKESVKRALDKAYPPEVVERFFELLVQERILIIERGERNAKKKIAEMRKSSGAEIKREVAKLKKLKQEYTEFYCIYKEAEECDREYQAIMRESQTDKGEKTAKKQEMKKLKSELEEEIEGYRRRYDKERKTQGELVEKLEEAKETYASVCDSLKVDDERLKCEKEKLMLERHKLKEAIVAQKRRICELRNQVKMKSQKKCDCTE